MTQQSQKARVLAVLAEGPCTSSEVAAETGLSQKISSAYLCWLLDAGIVLKTGTMRASACPGCGHRARSSNIYAMASHTKGVG